MREALNQISALLPIKLKGFGDMSLEEVAQLCGFSLAIGDSLNDFPMLQSVDYPVLVQKPDGVYDQQVKLDNLILACGKGPVGWNEAILRLLC